MLNLRNSVLAALVGLMYAIAPASAQSNAGFAVAQPEFVERQVGPYNVHALEGGGELVRPVAQGSRMLSPDAPATLTLWVRITSDVPSSTLIAGVGDPSSEDSFVLGLSRGRPIVRMSRESMIAAPDPLTNLGWHLLTAVTEGQQTRLYVDGKDVARGGAIAVSLRGWNVIEKTLDVHHE